MVEIKNIIELIAEKDICKYNENHLFFNADNSLFINKDIVHKIYKLFNSIEIQDVDVEKYNKILVPMDDLSMGLLNFGYYIKLIHFLNEFDIIPILIFKSVSISPHFVQELIKNKDTLKYIVHVENINKNDFRIKKEMLKKKYNCNKIMLTDLFFIENEEDFSDYIFLLHDGFIDLYDTPYFHNNKMKDKITDSNLLFNNFVFDNKPKNLTYLSTDYFDTISGIEFEPIKPYSVYGEMYSPKEQKIVKTNLNRKETKEMTKEIFSILGYYEDIDSSNNKFRHFNSNTVITDTLDGVSKNGISFVYDIDDSMVNNNIIKLCSDNILESLKEMLTATMDEEFDTESQIKYKTIIDFI